MRASGAVFGPFVRCRPTSTSSAIDLTNTAGEPAGYLERVAVLTDLDQGISSPPRGQNSSRRPIESEAGWLFVDELFGGKACWSEFPVDVSGPISSRQLEN